jgi:hypothetical protein
LQKGSVMVVIGETQAIDKLPFWAKGFKSTSCCWAHQFIAASLP